MNQQPRGRKKIRGGEKREFERCGKMTGQELFSIFIFLNFQLLFSALDFWVRQQLRKIVAASANRANYYS